VVFTTPVSRLPPCTVPAPAFDATVGAITNLYTENPTSAAAPIQVTAMAAAAPPGMPADLLLPPVDAAAPGFVPGATVPTAPAEAGLGLEPVDVPPEPPPPAAPLPKPGVDGVGEALGGMPGDA